MTKYEEFYGSKILLKGSGTQRTTNCPFCRHKNDLSINIETGQCKCFQCDFEGDTFDFLERIEGIEFKEVKKELMKYGIRPITEKQELGVLKESAFLSEVIGSQMLDCAGKCASNVPGHVISYLKETRGLNDEIVNRYQIGFCTKHPNYQKDKYERLSIPIRKNGKIINVRFHAIGKVKEGDYKALPYCSDLPEATSLFPEDQLENDVVYLTEGELDALCAISHGLSAVSATGGAGSWKEEWTPLFEEKKVRIIYDCDTTGRKGAGKIAAILSSTANEVKVIDLGLKDKEDLTDWFVKYGRTKEELEKLVSKTETMKKPTKTATKKEETTGLVEELSIQSLTLEKLLKIRFTEEQSWVNRGLVPKGGFVLLAGLTKRGKTTITLQLCLRLIHGHCTFLQDFEIQATARILYIYAENCPQGLQNIIRKQLRGLTWDPSEDDLKRLSFQPRGRMFLDNNKGLSVLEKLVDINTPDLVVLDPISRFIGKDINDMRTVNSLFDGLSGISNDITWFFISHYRKPARKDIDQGIYKTIGSSAFANNCDTFMGLERTDKHRTGLYNTLYIILRRDKPIEPINLYWNTDSLLFEAVEKKEVLSGGVKAIDVVTVLKEDFKGKAAYTPLTELVSDRFKITKQRVGGLLRNAKKLGLVNKESGHFGKWFCL